MNDNIEQAWKDATTASAMLDILRDAVWQGRPFDQHAAVRIGMACIVTYCRDYTTNDWPWQMLMAIANHIDTADLQSKAVEHKVLFEETQEAVRLLAILAENRVERLPQVDIDMTPIPPNVARVMMLARIIACVVRVGSDYREKRRIEMDTQCGEVIRKFVPVLEWRQGESV